MGDKYYIVLKGAVMLLMPKQANEKMGKKLKTLMVNIRRES